MSKITKIVSIENHDTFARVHVLVDEQEEAVVWVGGEVEIFHDDKYDKTKAWVKKTVDKTIDNDESLR